MPYTFLHDIKETITKIICSSGFDTWKKFSTRSRTGMESHKNYSRANNIAVWHENIGGEGILVLFM